MESQIRVTDSKTALPAEYWEPDGRIHGALISNVTEDGILIKAVRDIPLGSDLHLRLFYANEYELDGINLVARINWRRPNIDEDWQGYLYGLEFVEISSEDHEKLIKLNRHLPSEGMSEGNDIVCKNPSSEKVGFSSPSSMLPNSSSRSYENGRCPTPAFSDLSQFKDKTIPVNTSITAQKSEKHRSGSLASVLSRFGQNVKLVFRNQQV